MNRINIRYVLAATLLALVTSGCSSMSRNTVTGGSPTGAAVGAVVGGVIGNEVDKKKR